MRRARILCLLPSVPFRADHGGALRTLNALRALDAAFDLSVLAWGPLGAGLLTPVGTILIGAVMTTAILTAHARNGIWSHEGGFEFPLLLLALGFVISALGAGSYSINAWAHVSNWAGIHWSMSHVARAAIVLAIGVGGGLATVLLGYVARSAPARPSVPATS